MKRLKKIILLIIIPVFAGCSKDDGSEKQKKLEKQKNIIHKLKSKDNIPETDKQDTAKKDKTKSDLRDSGSDNNLEKSPKPDVSYTLKKLKRVPEAVPALPEKLLNKKPNKRPKIPKIDRNSSKNEKPDDCKSGNCKNAEKLGIHR